MKIENVIEVLTKINDNVRYSKIKLGFNAIIRK